MRIRNSLFPTIATLSILVLTGPAQAATQGTAGDTSNGSSTVSLGKLSNVKVSEIDDINLGSYAFLATPAIATDQICVFSSNVAYKISFDQDGGSFELSGESTSDTIPYAVSFTGIGVPATASEGVPIEGQIGNAVDASCLGAPNASYVVSVAAADFNAAQPDNYSAVLDILVEPE